MGGPISVSPHRVDRLNFVGSGGGNGGNANAVNSSSSSSNVVKPDGDADPESTSNTGGAAEVPEALEASDGDLSSPDKPESTSGPTYGGAKRAMLLEQDAAA